MKSINMTGKELDLLNNAISETKRAYKALLPKPGLAAGVDDSPGDEEKPSTESLLSMVAAMQMVTMFDRLNKDFEGLSWFDCVRETAPRSLVSFSNVSLSTDDHLKDTMTMEWDSAQDSSAHLLFLALYQHHMRQRPLNIPLMRLLERLT
ncbi:hypothetical protein [Halomonas sp. Mc5H-6]|uniref:hypothetical protein n=1 Tax=Halomonas sp. Mc5H-6 TaxID=2954500 RepID=UPI002096F08A|nr:hypothetical protein [Halomonas sp. Mc5H-6]MCO7246387.1 hypothetical protein [Halomonas sp. Mc5H-6]